MTKSHYSMSSTQPDKKSTARCASNTCARARASSSSTPSPPAARSTKSRISISRYSEWRIAILSRLLWLQISAIWSTIDRLVWMVSDGHFWSEKYDWCWRFLYLSIMNRGPWPCQTLQLQIHRDIRKAAYQRRRGILQPRPRNQKI